MIALLLTAACPYLFLRVTRRRSLGWLVLPGTIASLVVSPLFAWNAAKSGTIMQSSADAIPVMIRVLAPQAKTTAEAAAAPQIEWQRSLADSLLVQAATGKPLLLVLNIDDETFCEQFAKRTYRDPAFIAATRGYVCLIASGERHTDSDYDAQGRRIECPRFGSCTCSEHINNGVLMFTKYFGGQSAAPRHCGVAANGKVLFDRFLDGSMTTAIDAIATHAATGKSAPLPQDLPALLLLRDAAARAALERSYLAATDSGRKAILSAAATAVSEPFDLLRIGLRSEARSDFELAANALEKTATKDALIDLEDALARCDDAKLTVALDAAVARIEKDDAAAKQFAQHRRAALAALGKAATAPFLPSLGKAAPALDRDAAEAALDKAEAAGKHEPKDASLQLAIAFATLNLARSLQEGSGSANLMREDARRIAELARKMARGEEQLHLADALRTILFAESGDLASAQRCAAEGMKCLFEIGFDGSPFWVCELLRAAAQSAAAAAYQKSQQDANAVAADEIAAAAYAFLLLAKHHAHTAADVQKAAQLLAFAGARRDAQELLRDGLQRFPDNNDLHAEYRTRLALDRGALALRTAYAAFGKSTEDQATAEWFAGYADLVAAEMFVKQSDDRAAPAYKSALARFQISQARNAGYADSAQHFSVLAHAGLALILHQQGDAQGAVEHLLLARSLRPASMGEADGLARKPEAVLLRIARELSAAGKQDLADQLTKGQ